MTAYIQSLSQIEKFYLACAVLGGVLFVFRTLMFVVGHHGGDIGGDVHGDFSEAHGDSDSGFRILSLQSLSAFFMMFGLVALAISDRADLADGWAVSGGMAAGLLTVWVIGRIFRVMSRLQSDGTMHIGNAVGQEGEVYLTVAPGKSGQVRVSVQGQLRIFDAVTEGSEPLKTGDHVKVVRVTNGNVLVVEKA